MNSYVNMKGPAVQPARSDGNIKIMKGWISDCVTKHAHCSKSHCWKYRRRAQETSLVANPVNRSMPDSSPPGYEWTDREVCSAQLLLGCKTESRIHDYKVHLASVPRENSIGITTSDDK
jgi:hypothetical protein